MWPINLDRISSLMPAELPMLAAPAPASRRGPADSFEQHLDQARRTAGASPSDDRPPADSRSPSDDRPPAAQSADEAARDVHPGRSQDDRSTSMEREADSAPEARGSQSPTDADDQAPVSDTAGKPDEEKEKKRREASAGESAQPADAAGVEAAAKASLAQGVPDDSAEKKQDAALHEGQAGAGKASPKRAPGTSTGEATDSGAPTSERESGAEKEQADARAVRASHALAKDGKSPDEAKASAAADGEASATEPQGRGSAADARRQEARHGDKTSVATSLSGRLPAVQAADSGEETIQEVSRLASEGDAVKEVRAHGATAGPTPADHEGQAQPAAPERAEPAPGARQAPTTASQERSGVSQADRVRFVQRVARAFEALGDRGGSIRLRLHPPELGSLRMEVTVRHGTMNARLEVESQAARTAVLDNLPALRDRLAQQQIKVGRFDVDLFDGSAGRSPQGPGSHPQPHDRADQGAPRPGTGQERETERPVQPRAAAPSAGESQLDVFI